VLIAASSEAAAAGLPKSPMAPNLPFVSVSLEELLPRLQRQEPVRKPSGWKSKAMEGRSLTGFSNGSMPKLRRIGSRDHRRALSLIDPISAPNPPSGCRIGVRWHAGRSCGRAGDRQVAASLTGIRGVNEDITQEPSAARLRQLSE
jgi:hypothetical protein